MKSLGFKVVEGRTEEWLDDELPEDPGDPKRAKEMLMELAAKIGIEPRRIGRVARDEAPGRFRYWVQGPRLR